MSKLHFMPNSLFQVWAVNVSNKMRDIEFEAQMLLNSPEALPPTFQ